MKWWEVVHEMMRGHWWDDERILMMELIKLPKIDGTDKTVRDWVSFSWLFKKIRKLNKKINVLFWMNTYERKLIGLSEWILGSSKY